MTKFNDGKPMKEKFKHEITEYFDYKWKNDRNMAIDDDDEKAILEQLPNNVEEKLFFSFLH